MGRLITFLSIAVVLPWDSQRGPLLRAGRRGDPNPPRSELGRPVRQDEGRRGAGGGGRGGGDAPPVAQGRLSFARPAPRRDRPVHRPPLRRAERGRVVRASTPCRLPRQLEEARRAEGGEEGVTDARPSRKSSAEGRGREHPARPHHRPQLPLPIHARRLPEHVPAGGRRRADEVGAAPFVIHLMFRASPALTTHRSKSSSRQGCRIVREPLSRGKATRRPAPRRRRGAESPLLAWRPSATRPRRARRARWVRRPPTPGRAPPGRPGPGPPRPAHQTPAPPPAGPRATRRGAARQVRRERREWGAPRHSGVSSSVPLRSRDCRRGWGLRCRARPAVHLGRGSQAGAGRGGGAHVQQGCRPSGTAGNWRVRRERENVPHTPGFSEGARPARPASRPTHQGDTHARTHHTRPRRLG